MTFEEVKTPSATIRVVGHNIVENIIHDNVTIDREDVLAIKEANMSLTKGNQYAILVNAGPFSSITREARELSASKEFSEQTRAKALLVSSLGHRIVGQFYIRINKPHIKTKIFSERSAAMDWLERQLN